MVCANQVDEKWPSARSVVASAEIRYIQSSKVSSSFLKMFLQVQQAAAQPINSQVIQFLQLWAPVLHRKGIRPVCSSVLNYVLELWF